MKFLILIILFYLAGSVNFSILLFRFLGKGDPRKSHSGNAGVTNVYRIAGPAWAAAVLILDVGRAVVIGLLAGYALSPGQTPWAGLALVIGNRYPCFHQFRGGKGVANYLGFTAAVTPAGAAVSAITWVLVYLVKRAPFIASFAMIAVLALGTIVACGYRPGAVTGAIITVLFIIFNHRKNIEEFLGKKEEVAPPDRDEG
ncbi:MAG TPA: glycerol-3-phosphate acyltransferase [Spirochaetota bacterium]|nr:glycerol-3-phosphate acyltransferase [Spirochaetota bacterium]HPC40078.1 glycerol-3-phosphate acyltransferase [Spirochaetota bacterium]HPL16858.1 glycerol-3-phosphate acyltransferase [Spirochaetota bacterium]HQF08482.1 glycerol-3-phosphate acyltransferase [Spirochaetota bacterium]HQH97281.1 glycerol-3-phosphate acyltransferase [Spirochaetota bacterium]